MEASAATKNSNIVSMFYEEVKFRGAILELRDSGCLRAITDVGGAGLNSAVGEMGDPVGVWLNTVSLQSLAVCFATYSGPD
jgi:hypothetical protein